MGNIDWARLVLQGRAKAHGISWNAEELTARYKLGIPADAVRRGIITTEDYQADLEDSQEIIAKGEELPLGKLKKDELLAKAKEVGIEIAEPNMTTKADLVDLIKTKVEE
jgi:hypothetical protein